MSEPGKPSDASFLARWSRRKVEAAAPAVAPGASADAPVDGIPLSTSSTGAPAGDEMAETPHPEPGLPVDGQVTRELPSIESLTHEADFSPFLARDVDPALRNRALKKLFTNPHYQFAQMDKLDIYIDDYSQPDPIPLEMLRKMNQAKSLFLFEDEEKAAPHADTQVVISSDLDGPAHTAGPPTQIAASDEAGAGIADDVIKDPSVNVDLAAATPVRKPA